MTKFWVDGFDQRAKAIRKDFERRLHELKQILEHAPTKNDAKQIKREIKDLKARYRRTLRDQHKELH